MGDAGGRARLRELIRRYRAEIRADLLQVFGVDLARWWVDRRWKALLELIDQLPSASRFNEAVQNDPEQAELIALAREEAADQDTEGEAWSPRVAEYDLHANLLRDLIQAVLGLQAATVAAQGGKPGQVMDYPTPKTEVDRAVARMNLAWAKNMAARFGFDPDEI
ncbi:hypothetical protein [Georgenia thermotolerans]|uniref:hypothetical protein n=1 Tax=Georgenia thermotolerans TaxID=527326 RepID=UPI00126560AD|nr:hypothetical protein [Georgenia thermotolerans]